MGYYLLYTKGTELWLRREDLVEDQTQAEQALENLEGLVYVKMDCIVESVAEAI